MPKVLYSFTAVILKFQTFTYSLAVRGAVCFDCQVF